MTTQQIGWLSRPDGGRMFTPGKAHDVDVPADLDAVGSLRTACGTDIPTQVLRQMRGARLNPRTTYTAILMDADEIATAAHCKRCAKKTGGTR